MEIDPSDPVDRLFYLHAYAVELVLFIARYVSSGDLCVDAGAQKGYIALHLVKAVGPSGEVFCFEPDLRAAEKLRDNRDHNKITNISVYNGALGEKNGTCDFNLSSQIGWSTQFPNELASGTLVAREVVDVLSLDSVFLPGRSSDLKRLTFIKLDCEGAEPLVLAGMKQVLERADPVLWIEINHSSLKAGGFSAAVIEAFLRKRVYSFFLPVIAHRKTLVLRTLDAIPTNPESFDIVAVRKEGESIRRLSEELPVNT